MKNTMSGGGTARDRQCEGRKWPLRKSLGMAAMSQTPWDGEGCSMRDAGIQGCQVGDVGMREGRGTGITQACEHHTHIKGIICTEPLEFLPLLLLVLLFLLLLPLPLLLLQVQFVLHTHILLDVWLSTEHSNLPGAAFPKKTDSSSASTYLLPIIPWPRVRLHTHLPVAC